MKRFALVGAAGFVAPRHMKAIRETGNQLVMAVDPFDSVGVIDSYFPECNFYTDYQSFLKDLQENSASINFTSICTPNFLHFEHTKHALLNGSDVICEKPLVIDPAHLDELAELERQTGKRVYSIFQLRLHPSIIELRDRLRKDPNRQRVTVNLHYVTRRGPWYHVSWKGEDIKSGGLAMNIGIHFFDALIWIFGGIKGFTVKTSQEDKVAGTLELEWADVNWFLSIDLEDLPKERVAAGKTAFRSITIEGEELEFTDGFTDLHTVSYNEIIAGRGIGVEGARPALELVHALKSC